MSDTPSPSLLSEERIGVIRRRSEKSAGFTYQSEAMNDRADLLQHLYATRQAVAEQLWRLLSLANARDKVYQAFMKMIYKKQ